MGLSVHGYTQAVPHLSLVRPAYRSVPQHAVSPSRSEVLNVLARLLDERARSGVQFRVDEAKADTLARPEMSERERAERWGWHRRQVRALAQTGTANPHPPKKGKLVPPRYHAGTTDTPKSDLKADPGTTLVPRADHSPTLSPEYISPPMGSPPRATPKRFVPPSVAEVVAYAESTDRPVDQAEPFVDYHISKGWKVGREPMKDWRAAFRTWCRKAIEFDRRPAREKLDLNAAIPRAEIPAVIERFPALTQADFSPAGDDWRGQALVTLRIERRIELGIFTPPAES